MSRALGDLFWERGDDDVGGDSWFDDQAHVVFAVIGAIPQQEKTRLDGPGRQLQVDKGHIARVFKGKRYLSILSGEDGAEVELGG